MKSRRSKYVAGTALQLSQRQHLRLLRVVAPVVSLLLVASATVISTPANAAGAVSNGRGNRLYVGQTLRVGGRLVSPSGAYEAILERHGTVQILHKGNAVWSNTRSSDLSKVTSLQSNGGLKIRSSKTKRRFFLALQNTGNLTLYSGSGVPTWQVGPHAGVSPSSEAPYTANDFYGGANPALTCFTCAAANVTGVAPPSNTLDAGAGVDNLTGDFSTANTLFDAPTIGGDLGLTLTYDAQLAQTGESGLFGSGWSSDFAASLSSNGYRATVNQSNGAEVTFQSVLSAATPSATCSLSGTVNAQYYQTTGKFTVPGSGIQWCASAATQGQLGEVVGVGYTYETQGGVSVQDFAWDGQLDETTTLAASSGSPNAGLFNLYDVQNNFTPAATSTGVTLNQQCPTYDTCDIAYASDGRDVVEVLNSSGRVTQVIDPSGATYNMTYSTSAPYTLLSVAKPSGTSSPSVWNYVYTGSNVTLEEIYDPDAGVTTPATLDAGAPHSETIAYSSGMVSSLTDGAGAETTYSYATPCSTGACVGTGATQTTTVTYPAEVPSPGGTAQHPVETDQYTSGLETSTTLGSTTNANESETWGYTWNLGNGAANTSEVVTYPSTLNVANSASWVAPTATIIWDPAGNIVSTTNALGESDTSAYNDQGANNLPELLWSFPGPSSNPPSSPPAGSTTYTYNNFGQVVTATDPVGSTTTYGYYGPYSLLCYAAPPSVSATLGGSAPSCADANTDPATDVDVDAGASGAPIGSTTYSYDVQGNTVSTTVDAADGGSNADPQTTTSAFDVMGNQLWTVPPAGQSGVQGPTNPFATSTTYSSADLPLTVRAPDAMTTSHTYDPAFNVLTTATPSSITSVVYDGDNRDCYTATAATALNGVTCSSPRPAGSSAITYVPGSLAVATSTDANGNVTSNYYGDLAYPMSPTEVLDPLGTQPAFTAYDDYGDACVTGSGATTLSATQCTAPSGDTATTFDALGSQTSVTDPAGNVIDYYYEDSSFPTLVTRRVISPSTATETTRYSYDADGRLLTTTNPDGTAVSLAYNVNGQVCSQQPTALVFPCGEGPAVPGVSEYVYNDAGERTSMIDNVGAPNATQWAQTTSYTYAADQLTSTTNANNQTVSYLYNYAGQVACVAYPVSSGASCGTLTSPATGSSTNTIVQRSYDSSGRLSSVTDWLGNITSYSYADAWTPNTPTTITYPSSTGLTATYGYDNDGNSTSLSAGSSVSDTWTYNADSEVATSKTNSSTSSGVGYNANKQITAAANLAQSTSNDTYTIAGNGEITSDTPPSGSGTDFTYNAADELCNTSTSSVACGTNPSTGTAYTYTSNGERASVTPYASGVAQTSANYSWNPYGELCNVSSASSTSCGSTLSTGASYTYNGDGLRTAATTVSSGTVTSTTASAWDTVTGGSIPLNINDATTISSGTTNTSYIYGDLLLGGTAPVEQITTNGSGAAATFIVANQTGVQGVYGSNGTSLEQALYSTYGKQTIVSGSDVTPFGFQGSYADSTGLIYLINRYYDPTTDQFLSIDSAVARTNQPYVYTGDNPLNAEDPLGLGANSAVTTLSKALNHLAATYKEYKANPNLRTSGAYATAKRSFEKDAVAANTAVTQSVSEATNTGVTQVPSIVATAQSQQAQVQGCYNSATALAAEGGITGAVFTVGGAVPEFLATFGIDVATGGIGLIFTAVGIVIVATTSGVGIYEASQC